MYSCITTMCVYKCILYDIYFHIFSLTDCSFLFSRSDFVTLPFQGAEVLLDNIAPLPGTTLC